MTLEELWEVINDSTKIDIVDADTGEVYASGWKDDMNHVSWEGPSWNQLLESEVMDMNVYKDTLTICLAIEQDEDDWYDEEEARRFDWYNEHNEPTPEEVEGWIQEDTIAMYRRER